MTSDGQVLSLLVPPPPPSWDASKDLAIHAKVSTFMTVALEPVGKAFQTRAKSLASKRTLTEEMEMEQALLDAEGDLDAGEEDEVESAKLLRSDPGKWKDQDHYAVLGLSKKRHGASEDDIKRAYRRKVLKHHPDKKKAVSGKAEDDSFFKCVQKAWEVLSDPKRRREWDSCDPEFDEDIPSAKAKGDFFDIYAKAFEKESRFSRKSPVPTIGTMDSPRADVELFYDFWFSFDSWRTFERMDEEDPDSAESREEKRWIDRKNKSARQKLKKEDIGRLNKLVEQAFSLDPRIRKFKSEEKAARDAKKNEKLFAAQAAAEEAKKRAEEEALAKAAAEEAEREKAAAEKKDREALKNANRKEKKAIKRILKEYNNFLTADAKAVEIENQLTKLDEILTAYETPELVLFRTKLEEAIPMGVDHLILVFDEEHMSVQELASTKNEAGETAQAASKAAGATKESAKAPWAPKEMATLIKAVKLYPGGTLDRWAKIAEYVNEHGGEEGESAAAKSTRQRSAKECIATSKTVQQAASADRAKLQASVQKPVPKVDVKDPPTVRLTDSKMGEQTKENKTPAAADKNAGSPSTMMAPLNASWNADQQTALENGLRTFPAAAFRANPNERWAKIAETIQGKSVKEVKARVKELAELAKTKKK